MELLELNVNIRKMTGNSPARVLRRNGRIPAVLYGPKTETILLSINHRELELLLKKSSSSMALFSIIIEDNTNKRTAMLKELQTHPLTSRYIHADFYEIDMDKKIKIMVPVRAKGKPKGIEDGGILQIIRREIEVFCLPVEIPEIIEIDVTDLDIGDSIHINDIKLGNNIDIPFETNFTILTISIPTKEDDKKTGEAVDVEVENIKPEKEKA